MIEQKILKLLAKATKQNEVPVAAIIVKNGKIISSAYNKRNKTNCVLNHAEVIAINKATKKLKNWRLDGCTLYVSLEPCDMCKKIIESARIKKVKYYINKNNDYGFPTKYEHIQTKSNEIMQKKLNYFFVQKRKK